VRRFDSWNDEVRALLILVALFAIAVIAGMITGAWI
jgi:hypothetical protein